jgi:hypothetical protein
MVVSDVMLSGAASSELIVWDLALSVPVYRVNAADGRLISVGISTARFCCLGVRNDGDKLGSGWLRDQVLIAAQHVPCLAAARSVQRFEDAHDKALALGSRVGFGVDRLTAHR